MNVNEKPYNVKSNNRVVYTTLDALKAHNFAIDLAERTNEAVTVDPDPLHDLKDFARDFPVNFKLACGYPGAKLPSSQVNVLTENSIEELDIVLEYIKSGGVDYSVYCPDCKNLGRGGHTLGCPSCGRVSWH
jgi:hypothetical protein